MERLRAIEREGLRTNIPDFAPGDTVRVMVRVREGDKERLQAFEGVCIARRGGGINETFTVRKISAGVGVERIFPLHAPLIAEIGLLRKGRVRRAKLYSCGGSPARRPGSARSAAWPRKRRWRRRPIRSSRRRETPPPVARARSRALVRRAEHRRRCG